MGILSRLKGAQHVEKMEPAETPAEAPAPKPPPPPPEPEPKERRDPRDVKKEEAFNELKAKIHFRMLNLLDLTRLAEAPDSILQEDRRRGIDIILAEEKISLPVTEKERLVKEIRDELMGLGPLDRKSVV